MRRKPIRLVPTQLRSGRRALRIVGLVSVLALAWVGPVQAVGPMGDAMYAHWPGSTGLDTTSTMNTAKSGLSPQYNMYSTNPSSARAAMGSSYAQNDAIWWMAGHANIGYITSYNSTNGSTVIWTSGSVGGANCSAAKSTCLTNYTSAQMHDIRLMVFMGCHTGAAIPNSDRLPKRAVNNLGVDSSIGFTDEIGFSQYTSDYWVTQFTYYGMVNGWSVYNAAWSASNDVFVLNDDYHGYDSLVIYGGSTKIYPAAFGS